MRMHIDFEYEKFIVEALMYSPKIDRDDSYVDVIDIEARDEFNKNVWSKLSNGQRAEIIDIAIKKTYEILLFETKTVST